MRRLLALVLFLLAPTLAHAQLGTPAFRGQVTFPLSWPTDNTFDIGASGANRPRNLYVGTAAFVPELTVSGLTATRCTFAGAGGLLSDDADCTFSASRLTVTDFTSTNLPIFSGGTAGRVLYFGASGQVANDAGLTYDGTTLESIDQTNISGPDAGSNVEIGGATTDANAGTGGSTVAIGSGAVNNSNGANQVIIGAGANVNGTGVSNVVIGSAATTGSNNTQVVVVGANSTTAGSQSVVIGQGSNSGGIGSITIGNGANANGTQSIVIGNGANSSGNSNVFIAGSPSMLVTDVYFGRGLASTTASAYAVRGTRGSGTDNAGGGVEIAGGRGTGTSQGGFVQTTTSPDIATGSTLQTSQIREYYLAKSKALSEGAATSVLRLAIPAEEGVSGEFEYLVYATDGSTPQTRSGRVIFTASADGATETCVLGTPEELDNTPTGTLTATITCDTTPTQAIDIQINATSSLTQTVLKANVSLHMNTSAAGFTVTPQ